MKVRNDDKWLYSKAPSTKIITQTVEQVFFLHGHAIIEQEEYLVWRHHSMLH
jgi:hypothetical protein